jgi:hypothetical protein
MNVGMLGVSLGVVLVLYVTAACGAQGVADAGRVGLVEDCSTTDGWYEIDDDQKIPPRVKMSAGDGLLRVVTNRGRLEVAHRYPWVAPGADYLTRLHKDYGPVDMDKYHYVVVNIKAKGSAVFFAVNGFMIKAGYTTGVTCVDLADYDDPDIKGTQPVRLNLDLHDNMTEFVLDEVKFVSELTDEERARLIGKGLTIRDEGLTFEDYHGLVELKRRSDVPPPDLDREEMAVFRDTATGAISTRLTADAGNDFFGEGGCWSADGAALRFSATGRGLGGLPIYYLADGAVKGTGSGYWAQWSPAEPHKLLLVSRKGFKFTVSLWDRDTGKSEDLVTFDVPGVGSYTEVKRFTKSGKLVIAFRETHNFFVVDTINKTARFIRLSTRLKDAGLSGDEKFVSWYNCYTYENRWMNVETGEEGLNNEYSAGHGAGPVRDFGPYLKLIPEGDISRDPSPGDKIRIWGNWANRVTTDYGNFTGDGKWVFTNGTRGDVSRQHVMIPTEDTGAVLRVARYFTRFSWESTTYSRPSPDYTKLIYNENCFGPTQIVMVYTRRTDPPVNVKLEGKRISWGAPDRGREIKGYNVYASDKSGRDFAKVNDELVAGTSYELPDAKGCYAVTSVEHSRLESMLSAEVTAGDSHTLYFEAERQKLTTPARRFFNGWCNDFQCVRMNAESDEEASRPGVVSIDKAKLPAGEYVAWGLVKGKGAWTVAGQAAPVDSDAWQWVKLASGVKGGSGGTFDVSSGDDALMLDTVMLTTEDFTPASADPRDATPPAAVTGLKAELDKATRQVKLSWSASGEADLHHYSVYCGSDEGFPCDNSSIVRSVYKTSITDAGMAPGTVYYKVVARDGRWNASAPVTVKVSVE